MKRKLLQMMAIVGVTVASSVVMADESPLRVVVPMPPPTSAPSEADVSDITNAQRLLDTARKDAVAAHADLIKAQVNLNRITQSLQSHFETDGALGDAVNAVAAAKVAYESLAQPILVSLTDHATYREARAALAKAQQAADEVRARPQASTSERLAVAQAVLDAKARVAQLENTALDSNADLFTAKTNYLEAEKRLKATRVQLWQAIRQDPAYLSASQEIDEARERSTAADQQLATAKLDLYAAQRRLADKLDSRQAILDWTYRHGLPDPP
jgi:hypothetical protein